ncbi:MAG: MATE family efflux transporter [Phormidesmis sp.]
MSNPIQLHLPAMRVDSQGKRHFDYRAFWALAFPLFLNSGVQAILNLTDSWFIGRLSTDAIAAIGALYFLILVLVTLFGGVGMYVQTVVAQAYGKGNCKLAAQAVGAGCWCALLLLPLFVVLAFSSNTLLAFLQFPPAVEQLAIAYWLPRLLGGSIIIANLALTSFFNGIGRSAVTLKAAIVIALVNVLLNEVLMFQVGLGMAGAAWATTASLAVGLLLLLADFLSVQTRHRFRSHQVWRPQWKMISDLFKSGIPLGFLMTADLTGLALFQIMQVKLGVVPGAATQIAMVITSTAYMPTLGIAQAGTTLVGQSMGAGSQRWAKKVGNVSIALCVLYAAAVSFVIALSGEWLVPLFISSAGTQVEVVTALSQKLLWLAVIYNTFNGLSIGSAFCLQGAGDVKVPSFLAISLSWLLYAPLTHSLTFDPGEGFVRFLPQSGWGIWGGWTAAIIFSGMISSLLCLRWKRQVASK